MYKRLMKNTISLKHLMNETSNILHIHEYKMIIPIR
jgi:hypothetical protein